MGPYVDTTQWREGPPVDSNTKKGTAIAAGWDSNGHYPQSGQRNSGIYYAPGTANGSIRMIDQWTAEPGRPAHLPQVRELVPHNRSSASDSSDAYHVIYVAPR